MPAMCYYCKKEKVGSLHGFPKNCRLGAKWKEACGFYPNDNVNSIYLCSDHFKPDDFKLSVNGQLSYKRLKCGAIPSMNMLSKRRRLLLKIDDHEKLNQEKILDSRPCTCTYEVHLSSALTGDLLNGSSSQILLTEVTNPNCADEIVTSVFGQNEQIKMFQRTNQTLRKKLSLMKVAIDIFQNNCELCGRRVEEKRNTVVSDQIITITDDL